MVIKKDGTKELYDKSKIKKALMLACAKRKIDHEVISNIIAQLEAQRSLQGKEISSQQIGTDVLNALKTIDPIAYVRFASVYQSFDSVEQFTELLQ